MILGISGLYGAGKGEAVQYLQARSFYAQSLSDVIRDELQTRGVEPIRERMIEVGNEIRRTEGEGGLASRLAANLVADRNYVIDSIRHPAEVEVLRAHTEHFRLVWIDSDEAIRLDRIVQRRRGGDPTTLVELRRLEGQELGSEDPTAQQLLAVRDLADETIPNNGSLEGSYGTDSTEMQRLAPPEASACFEQDFGNCPE